MVGLESQSVLVGLDLLVLYLYLYLKLLLLVWQELVLYPKVMLLQLVLQQV